ncbi:MAG: hypothetical protein JXQ73_16990 [Phycisphaerae bacterium]|nr:hypothetical protein [Phycisphaerae bacterium]
MPVDLTTLRLLYLRRVVVTLANTLGLDAAMAFARWLARGVYDLNTPTRQRVEESLDLAFPNELTQAQRSRLACRAFENIAAFWVEVFFTHRRLRERSYRRFVEFENDETVEAIAASRRGALLVTAYFGNLAVTAYALAQRIRPLYVVIDEAQHPVLKPWQQELYRQPNVELIPRERARGRLADLLSSGRKVCLVGEHGRARGRGIEVPYLGRSLRCYPTVGLLARWCEVPVYVASARRLESPFRFSLSVALAADPLRLPQAEDATEVITRRYMAGLEGLIRAHPEQYMWTRQWDPQEADRPAQPAGSEGADPASGCE